MKGKSHGLFERQNLPGGSEKNQNDLSQDSQPLDQNQNLLRLDLQELLVTT
jgi:hypothetical protein